MSLRPTEDPTVPAEVLARVERIEVTLSRVEAMQRHRDEEDRRIADLLASVRSETAQVHEALKQRSV